MNPEVKGSRWLFSVDDCNAYRERHAEERSRPEIVPDDVADPDDFEALAEHYVEKVTANL